MKKQLLLSLSIILFVNITISQNIYIAKEINETENSQQNNQKEDIEYLLHRMDLLPELNGISTPDEVLLYDWNLDNNEWINHHKYEYSYGENESEISVIIYSWDKEKMEWYKHGNITRHFNENGNCTFKARSFWNNEQNLWEPEFELTTIYNSMNQVVSSESKFWDLNANQGIITGTTLYSYNMDNNLIQKTIQTWNQELELLSNFKQDEYIYEGLNLMELKSSVWETNLNDWKTDKTIKYDYDESSSLILRIESEINEQTSTLKEIIKYEYSYDEINNTKTTITSLNNNENWEYNGKVIDSLDENEEVLSQITYNWEYQYSDWNKYSSWDYTENEAGNIITYSYYIWELDQEIGKLKKDYTFDDDNNLIDFHKYIWDFENNTWNLHTNYNYEFENNLETRYSCSMDFNANWGEVHRQETNYLEDGQINEQFEYKTNDYNPYEIELVKHRKLEYIYEDNVGEEEIISKNNFKVFPNPNNGIFQITNDLDINQEFTVEVHNLNGQMIYQNQFSTSTNRNTIDLSNMNSGVFIVKIISDKQTTQQKILIQ